MKPVNDIVAAPSARAGAAESLNHQCRAYAPCVILGLGTTGAEIAKRIYRRTGDNPAVQIFASDTAPGTRNTVCGDDGLPESRFRTDELPSAHQAAEMAARFEGTDYLVPALQVCQADLQGEAGGGREQALPALDAVRNEVQSTPRIQQMMLDAHSTDDSAGITRTITVIVSSANGSTGNGKKVREALNARDAARQAMLPQPYILDVSVFEFNPAATAHAGTMPSIYGSVGAVAGSNFGHPAVAVPGFNGRREGEKVFDEVLLISTVKGKTMTREEMLTEAADAVLSRIDRREAAAGADFRNLKTLPENAASTQLGPRILSTRSSASLVFAGFEPELIAGGAAMLVERLKDPSQGRDPKAVERDREAVRKSVIGEATGAEALALRIKPVSAKQNVDALSARRKTEAASGTPATARRAVDETQADFARIRTAAQAEIERHLQKACEAFADDLRTRVVPAAITSRGITDTANLFDDIAGKIVSDADDVLKHGAEELAVRARSAADAVKRLKTEIDKPTGLIDRATDRRQKAAGRLIEALTESESAEYRLMSHRAAQSAFPRFAAVCREISAGLAEANEASIDRYRNASKGLAAETPDGVGWVERLPETQTVDRHLAHLFNPATIEAVAGAMARKISLGKPVDAAAEAARIVRAGGAELPATLGEYLASLDPAQVRRLVERLLQRVGTPAGALFDTTCAPNRKPASVLVITRPQGAAQVLFPFLQGIGTHEHKQIVTGDDDRILQFDLDSRLWAPGELKLLRDARAAYEALPPARQVLHAPYLLVGRSLPRWGVPTSSERSTSARTLLFDLLARGMAEKNNGDAFRLTRTIAARTSCPNSGLLGRGFDNAADALAAKPTLLNALHNEIAKHDRAVGQDDLVTTLGSIMEGAHLLVPRNCYDDLIRHIQSQIDTLIARGAGRNDDFGPPAF